MSSIYDELEGLLDTADADRMLDRLCAELRERKDYHGLFYALILRKRRELGLPAVHAGGSEQIPQHLQKPYEEAIREAARHVGGIYLEAGEIAEAWPFFRMIGEPAAVAQTLEQFNADDPEKCQQVIEIAFHEGVNPQKGIELILSRYGICNAITTMSQDLPFPTEVRQECIKRLVRALYRELQERLAYDISQRFGPVPEGASVHEMLRDHPDLFSDEFYHIDVSHLSSVVQFSLQLPPCEEMHLAIELCEYGEKLSPRFQPNQDSPFDEAYRDYGILLRTLAGIDVESGIAHFRAKAESANPEEVGTFPAEVFVNLLDRLGRHREAASAFSRYLAQADARRLNCPSLQELCHKLGDYSPLVEVSLRRGDLVNYAAGLLQQKTDSPSPTR